MRPLEIASHQELMWGKLMFKCSIKSSQKKKKKAANKKQGHSYIPSHKIYMEKGLESNL